MRNPVVLIHGIDDTCLLFDRLRAILRNRGWDVHAFDLVPCNGAAGIEELAAQVEAYVETAIGGNHVFDLIGFSMGGLVARYCVQRIAAFRGVERLITVSAPHHGTWTALLRANKGARQMRRGSDFLRRLNSDAHVLKRISFTSIWSPLDLMILPAASSVMAEAVSIPVMVPAHAMMMRDRRVTRLIEQSLTRDNDDGGIHGPAGHLV